MFSVPPARIKSASPHWMACAASIADLRPEPHTLLTVVAPTDAVETRAHRHLTCNILAQPRAEDIAEDHFIDIIARYARLHERSLGNSTAQLGRRDPRQIRP